MKSREEIQEQRNTKEDKYGGRRPFLNSNVAMNKQGIQYSDEKKKWNDEKRLFFLKKFVYKNKINATKFKKTTTHRNIKLPKYLSSLSQNSDPVYSNLAVVNEDQLKYVFVISTQCCGLSF